MGTTVNMQGMLSSFHHLRTKDSQNSSPSQMVWAHSLAPASAPFSTEACPFQSERGLKVE